MNLMAPGIYRSVRVSWFEVRYFVRVRVGLSLCYRVIVFRGEITRLLVIPVPRKIPYGDLQLLSRVTAWLHVTDVIHTHGRPTSQCFRCWGQYDIEPGESLVV